MPDQIFAPGPLPAPLKYNVPGSQRMIPRACQAVFNGSGASGDFIPALIFRSQAGHVISRAILGSTVAAGDDAEVSWFPHVGGGGTSAADLNDVAVAASGIWLDVANLGDAPFAVAAGATSPVSFVQASLDTTAFDAPPSLDSLTLLLDAAFHASGLHNAQYMLSLSVLWETANFPRAAWIDVPLNQSTSVNGPQYFDYHGFTAASAFTTANPTGLGVLWCKDSALVMPKASGLTIQALVTNGDAVSRNVIAAYLMGYCYYYNSFS